MRSDSTTTKEKLRAHFHQVSAGIFWRTDLSNLVNEYRRERGESNLSVQQAEKFLLKEGLLRKAEFRSKEYPPVTRYLRGNPSSYELAVSLRRESFLCHRTALTLHNLEPPATTIYVNKEQGLKPPSKGITQEGINRAFENDQRRSNYIFRYEQAQFVLISGKNTGKAGVTPMRVPNGAVVNTTDLERTLIDIVVRPAYAEGVKRVFAAYKQAASSVNIGHMIWLLQKIDYAYPYHQSIGFLLQRAGRSERECRQFKDLGLDFDFFLDYGLKRPEYDSTWRLYYPLRLA
jgi:hypothetical protein